MVDLTCPTYQWVSDDSGEEDDDVECNKNHLEGVHAHPTPTEVIKK